VSAAQQKQAKSPSKAAKDFFRRLQLPSRGPTWPRVRPTAAGLAVLTMLAVLGLVAANPGVNLSLLLFGLGVGAVLFSALVVKKQTESVEVRRILPDVAAVGRPARFRYEVRNRSGWMAVRSLWIVDRPAQPLIEPPAVVAYLEKVEPRGSAVVESDVIPARRGWLQLDSLRLSSRFPFGFLARTRRMSGADQLLVWPALWRPRINWLRGAIWQEAHEAARSQWRPGSEEFYGIREYRPGDNVRWIHWRRSAAFGRLLVREMAEATPGRVTLALETAGPDGPLSEDVLDLLVSAAGSLACDALERGWQVGLIANAAPNVVLPPAGGAGVRARLLYELAVLAGSARGRLAEVLADWLAGVHWSGRAILLVGAEPDEDPAIEAAATRLARGIGPVVTLSTKQVGEWFALSDGPSRGPGGDAEGDASAAAGALSGAGLRSARA